MPKKFTKLWNRPKFYIAAPPSFFDNFWKFLLLTCCVPLPQLLFTAAGFFSQQKRKI